MCKYNLPCTEVLDDAWLPLVGRVVEVEQNDLLHLLEEVVTVKQMALEDKKTFKNI